MKFDTKDITSLLPHVLKNPSLVITIFVLFVPLVLLFSASKFATSSNEALMSFTILGIATLVFTAWVYNSVLKFIIKKDSKK